MKKSQTSFIATALGVGAILLSTSAFADNIDGATKISLYEALRIAYETGKTIDNELQQGDTRDVAKRSLDIQVAEGVQAFRDAGKNALADKYESEWKLQILPHIDQDFDAIESGEFQIEELGDHPALSPWLANFYDKLNTETHGLINSSEIVVDINTMNYALAVVLFPNGSWRSHTSYDRIEYRKHFIPFANIVTYWVTLEGCNFYLDSHGLKTFSQVCSYGADYLEKEMGRHLAPHLSDEVWHLATGEAIPPLPVPPHPSHLGFVAESSQQADTFGELSLADFQSAVVGHFSN